MARQFGEGRAEPPLPITVTGEQPVDFQPHGKPVRRGAGQVGAFAEIRQPTGGLGHGVEHPHRFVQHADAAILSHKEILPSQIVR